MLQYFSQYERWWWTHSWGRIHFEISSSSFLPLQRLGWNTFGEDGKSKVLRKWMVGWSSNWVPVGTTMSLISRSSFTMNGTSVRIGQNLNTSLITDVMLLLSETFSSFWRSLDKSSWIVPWLARKFRMKSVAEVVWVTLSKSWWRQMKYISSNLGAKITNVTRKATKQSKNLLQVLLGQKLLQVPKVRWWDLTLLNIISDAKKRIVQHSFDSREEEIFNFILLPTTQTGQAQIMRYW